MRWLRPLRALWLGSSVVCPRDPGQGERVGVVLGWGRRGDYREGDPVPHLQGGRSTFSVQTTAGWWANVAKGRLTGWSTKPIHFPYEPMAPRRATAMRRSRVLVP